MKIAVLCHVRQPIAQPFAGGMESQCWHLAAGLQARGHDVVLFASGDSDPRFAIDAVVPEHYERTFPGAEHRGFAPLIAYLDSAYATACDRIAAGGFDVVHNNSLHRFPLAPQPTAAVPTVTSLHVPPYDALRWFVQSGVVPGHRLTVTSQAQLSAWWPDGAPAEASILYNGIDPDAWPFVAQGNGSAVWCGRMTMDKGPHLAAQAARLAGVPLNLFGPIEDHDYWATAVEPLLGGDIRYGGHLDATGLAAAIGRASVFVFTPCWDEPFGLVAVEAMACGVPVAAFDRGAVREIVGGTGRFAPPLDVPALAQAIVAARHTPRRPQRARVEALFTRNRWLDRCESLYRDLIAARSAKVA
ncbi:glycosyltransferase [Sphingomonas prati]|uniref:Glycosyltransferase involved in cell wall biosynthesis n=1 Tax=Sphingomonas prati TaxID=1843237 RepID=A0A7W9BV67_9SPHN|nr:glycosyltransferase [Sphingomonas prati]MBB5730717.1 glycosyltransferase involved in cell wall biosynthesis [Sphingomonas prati]GGE95750.1 glycosyl transferase family 1 [Sphingomonas prati]